MLQENAFHNLLFLLEKRRKRGEGPKQNKQEEREMEGGGGGVKGKKQRHQTTAGGWSLCGPICWQEGGEGYWAIQRQKIVSWCTWVYLTLSETQTDAQERTAEQEMHTPLTTVDTRTVGLFVSSLPFLGADIYIKVGPAPANENGFARLQQLCRH